MINLHLYLDTSCVRHTVLYIDTVRFNPWYCRESALSSSSPDQESCSPCCPWSGNMLTLLPLFRNHVQPTDPVQESCSPCCPCSGIMFTLLPLFDLVYSVPTATFTAPFSTLGQTPEGERPVDQTRGGQDKISQCTFVSKRTWYLIKIFLIFTWLFDEGDYLLYTQDLFCIQFRTKFLKLQYYSSN